MEPVKRQINYRDNRKAGTIRTVRGVKLLSQYTTFVNDAKSERTVKFDGPYADVAVDLDSEGHPIAVQIIPRDCDEIPIYDAVTITLSDEPPSESVLERAKEIADSLRARDD